MIILIGISFNMCIGCSIEPFHCFLEYQQHIFGLENKKINLQLPTLICRPGCNPQIQSYGKSRNHLAFINNSDNQKENFA